MLSRVKVLFFFIWWIGIESLGAASSLKEYYPDFDQSLNRYGKSSAYYGLYYGKILRETHPLFYLQKVFFQELYEQEKNKFHEKESNSYKIPRIIHQIWLGGNLPTGYKKWTETWMNWEGWQYKLWTEAEVKQLSLYNSKLFQEAKNFGEKSDILRYEILYQQGGIYVDIDFKCLKPDFFDFANREYSFYAGIEPLENSPLRCGNALLASSPGHPLLEATILNLSDHVKLKSGFSTLIKTGPVYLTDQFYNNRDLFEDAIVFPPTFFYPIAGNEQKIWEFYCKPETAAVHFWERSWVKIEKK